MHAYGGQKQCNVFLIVGFEEEGTQPVCGFVCMSHTSRKAINTRELIFGFLTMTDTILMIIGHVSSGAYCTVTKVGLA